MSTQKHLNKSFEVGIFFGILHQFSQRNISAEKDTYVWMSMYTCTANPGTNQASALRVLLCFVKRRSSICSITEEFFKANEQTCEKALCNRSEWASLAAALIEVLS